VRPNPFPPRLDTGIPCPCCASTESAILKKVIPRRAIWSLLEAEWQAGFSEPVVRRHSPGEEVRLVECPACGLWFFDPLQGGDQDFYRVLADTPRYYAPWKWEFGWTLERLSPRMAVLDVGCGRGDFLAAVAPRVARVVGLESNPAAVAEGTGRGLDVYTCDMAEFSKDHVGAFDAVCAFHVVEHLPAPVPFLRSLLEVLRPGGSLFLSVPNRMRSAQAPLEPLDCPPHHLTRWGAAQLGTLSRILGVRLDEMAYEPVEVSVPRERISDTVKRAIEVIPVAGDAIGAWAARAASRILLPDFLYVICRHTGILERMGYYGLSMIARYTRSGS
jgi:SAM-dependent methyltransferase